MMIHMIHVLRISITNLKKYPSGVGLPRTMTMLIVVSWHGSELTMTTLLLVGNSMQAGHNAPVNVMPLGRGGVLTQHIVSESTQCVMIGCQNPLCSPGSMPTAVTKLNVRIPHG